MKYMSSLILTATDSYSMVWQNEFMGDEEASLFGKKLKCKINLLYVRKKKGAKTKKHIFQNEKINIRPLIRPAENGCDRKPSELIEFLLP